MIFPYTFLSSKDLLCAGTSMAFQALYSQSRIPQSRTSKNTSYLIGQLLGVGLTLFTPLFLELIALPTKPAKHLYKNYRLLSLTIGLIGSVAATILITSQANKFYELYSFQMIKGAINSIHQLAMYLLIYTPNDQPKSWIPLHLNINQFFLNQECKSTKEQEILINRISNFTILVSTIGITCLLNNPIYATTIGYLATAVARSTAFYFLHENPHKKPLSINF